MGEHLGLAGTGAGGDQQRRRRFGVAADAVFAGAALFRVEAVKMPPGIGRLQLRVPCSFAGDCNNIYPTGSQSPWLVWDHMACAFVRSTPGSGFSRGRRANRACGLRPVPDVMIAVPDGIGWSLEERGQARHAAGQWQ